MKYLVDRSPTLRQHLAHFPGWLWAQRDACGCTKAVPLYPVIARLGPDATLEDARRALRCVTCRAHPDGFTVPSPVGSHGYDVPPVERFAAPLRKWAKVNPAHLPAPLRGSFPSQSAAQMYECPVDGNGR